MRTQNMCACVSLCFFIYDEQVFEIQWYDMVLSSKYTFSLHFQYQL